MAASVARVWRWWSQPWRSPSTLLAVVVALATPVLMVASSQLFRASAADAVAEEQVVAGAAGAGVTVFAEGVYATDALGALDDEVSARLSGIDGLGEPERTFVAADVGLVTAWPTAPGEPPTVDIGSGGAVIVRSGAIEALDVLERADGPGLWISQTRAERLGLSAGDPIGVEGSADAVVVAGVYRDVWRTPRDPYWEDVPEGLLPRFSTVFGSPVREVYFSDVDTADLLALAGTARWDADLVDPPDGLAGLEELVADVRSLEADATGDPGYAAAIGEFGVVGGPVPTVDSDAADTLVDVRRRISDLEQPLAATTATGWVLGLIFTVAGASSIATRQRRELDLLRSDGDGGLRLAAATAVRYAPMAVVAAGSGVAGAVLVARSAGPFDGASTGAVAWGGVVAVTAVGLAVLAGTVSLMATFRRSTSPPSARAVVPWLVPLAALAVATWVQVGRADRRGEVDPLVVVFPIVAILTAVGVVSLLVTLLLRWGRRTGSGLPTVLFLAWRRLGAAGVGAVAIAVAIGSAVGLVAYSALLVDGLDDAVRAKVATEVGGAANAVLHDDRGGIPPDSSMIRRQSTLLTVGNRSVDVLAIDADTFAEAATIHPSVGVTPEEIVAALDRPVDADLAAVAVGDDPVPASAGFGTGSVFTYEIVDRVPAAPLARSGRTILVDADRLEAVGLERHRAVRPPDAEPAEWDAAYRSVLPGYRPVVVSGSDADELVSRLETLGAEIAEATSAAEVLDRLDNRAATWSFDHLRLLAAVAATAALAGLVLYLSQRRVERRLASGIAERMGLSRSRAIAVSVLESTGLATIAAGAGVASSVIVARHVFARFEPASAVPPSAALVPSVPVLLVIAVAAVLAVALVTTLMELAARRRGLAEVLRGL